MAKINILEPAVFNKIAAGEVVERPSSIVKELVENSIDSGATRIQVDVVTGGISKIGVSDNGCGMEKEDLEIAFLPHTTSKIKNSDDLNHISTLGFRGEALASICAVAKVSITTKTKESELAHGIKVWGGEVFDPTEAAGANGTTVVVEDLFFNVPVRAKFLKKPHQEEGEIRTLIARLILANPNVAIKYTSDDEIVYNSQGTGLFDAIFAIYGKNTVTNIIPVEATNGEYSLSGYVSKTNFFKPNRTYQTLIINGRYVTDYLISQAVGRAFEPFMLKQSFPLYVLNLKLPLEELDVNVHPSKMEVRFANTQKLFGFIYCAIKDAINKFLLNNSPEEFHTTNVNDVQPQSIGGEVKTNEQKPLGDGVEDLLKNMQVCVETSNSTPSELHDTPSFAPGEILIEKLQTTSFEQPTKILETDLKPVQQQILSDEIMSNDLELSMKVVGKVFNTFIIVEVDETMYLIDQHAAHERLLYDKLVKNIQNKEIKKQGLLIPYTFDVNSQEYEFLTKNIQVLDEMGFEIEPFGNRSFKVTTIPAELADIKLGNFFNDLLADLNTFLVLKTEDVLKDSLAQHACKHAVKGGDDLTKDELVALIKKVGAGDVTMQCPHGRPFVIEIKRSQIDKWFKRTL